MSRVLELHDVNVYYGVSHVLQELSLRVDPGEAVGLLGRNGAGKTTTIHSIMALAPVASGSIRYSEEEIAGLRPHEVARRGIALVPQGRRLFTDLTVEENLLLAARPGPWDLDRCYRFLPRLEERSGHGAGQLSGGEQQMVTIARALMTNPEVLLLDEPSEGLAPAIVDQIGEMLVDLKKEGLSILLVEQHFALALRVAERLYVMNKGRIVFDGPPHLLAMDEELKQQYLGV